MRPFVVTFKVTSCTAYLDATEPSYIEYLHQAWILRPATSKRPAGFVRSSDLPREEFHACLSEAIDSIDD